MKKIIIFLIVVILILAGLGIVYRDQLEQYFFRPQEPKNQGVNLNTTGLPESGDESEAQRVQTVVSDLEIPWEIGFLSDGSMIVTERPGRLIHFRADKKVIEVSGVRHVGEGGLLGLALHPDFEANQWLYLYLTSEADGGLVNRIERYKFSDDNLSERQVIFEGIPGAQYHDGGRIKFGPDGKLYVTTGDAGQADRAQDLDYLGGKILRLNDNGSIPDDNPFENSPIYSYGHRNPQGLAWDDQGQLWATEHGRSVPLSGYDELNLISSGQNYGWPIIQGTEAQEGLMAPLAQSGADNTWAPAGAVYYDGSIFFAGLRGSTLYEYKISEDRLIGHFYNDFGRLRALTIGLDGWFYISTSNTDGRGQARDGDDKIIRINPQVFR